MGDAEKDGDGAPDEGSAQNTQTDADHHVFNSHSDGGDYGFDRPFGLLSDLCKHAP